MSVEAGGGYRLATRARGEPHRHGVELPTRAGETSCANAIFQQPWWLDAVAPRHWGETTVERDGRGLATRTPLAPAERIEELLLLGLRLAEGIDRARFAARTGVDPLACVDARAVAELSAAGFIAVDAATLRATPAGRLRLNAVLARLLAAGVAAYA